MCLQPYGYYENFTFGFNDGTFDSLDGTVHVWVGGYNFPPLADDASVWLPAEDEPVIITLTGQDEQDSWIAIISQLPSRGILTQVNDQSQITDQFIYSVGTSVSNPNRAVAYIPFPDEYGIAFDSFKWKARDNYRELSIAPGTVKISAVDSEDAPRAVSKTVSMNEDILSLITLEVYDVDSFHNNESLQCYLRGLPNFGRLFQVRDVGDPFGENFVIGDEITRNTTSNQSELILVDMHYQGALHVVAFLPEVIFGS